MKVTKLDLGKYIPTVNKSGFGQFRYEKKLQLKTDGFLRLIFLGVGSAFAGKSPQSNMIIIKGDTSLVVDMGSTWGPRIKELNLTPHDFSDFMITHAHGDHIHGLEEYLLKKRYEAPFLHLKIKEGESYESFYQRIRELRDSGTLLPNWWGPEFFIKKVWKEQLAILADSERLDELNMRKPLGISNYANVKGIELVDTINRIWEFSINDINIRCFQNTHLPEQLDFTEVPIYSVGLVINDKIFISGDTQFNPEIVENHGKDCEILFHDNQLFSGGVHPSLDELTLLPEEYKNKMYLYHVPDPMFEMEDDLIKKGFKGIAKAIPYSYDFD